MESIPHMCLSKEEEERGRRRRRDSLPNFWICFWIIYRIENFMSYYSVLEFFEEEALISALYFYSSNFSL